MPGVYFASLRIWSGSTVVLIRIKWFLKIKKQMNKQTKEQMNAQINEWRKNDVKIP